jgi:hypothetical protein
MLFFPKITTAQTIDNVDFEVSNYSIKIKFDLINCPDNTIYNLNVFFTKADGTKIIPKSISTLNGIYPGRDKGLIWDFKNDKIEFTGDLSVTVGIANSEPIPPPPAIKHGPGNAMLSLLLPGWGDFYVNETDKTSPILISALYLGSAYMAYSSFNNVNTKYDIYLKATQQSVMDENYNAATSSLSQSQMFSGIAAAILIYDVIHVIVKGNKNVKNNTFSYNSIKFIPKINLDKGFSSYQFSLVKTF